MNNTFRIRISTAESLKDSYCETCVFTFALMRSARMQISSLTVSAIGSETDSPGDQSEEIYSNKPAMSIVPGERRSTPSRNAFSGWPVFFPQSDAASIESLQSGLVFGRANIRSAGTEDSETNHQSTLDGAK